MKRFICIILFIVTIATLTSCTANPTPITVECTCCCHTEESSGEGTKDFEKPYEGYIDSLTLISGYSYISSKDNQYMIEFVTENMVKIVSTKWGNVDYIPISSIVEFHINKENMEK